MGYSSLNLERITLLQKSVLNHLNFVENSIIQLKDEMVLRELCLHDGAKLLGNSVDLYCCYGHT